MTKKSLMTQSDILAGRLNTNTSKQMLNKVFTIMTRAEVSSIAKNEGLIVALGEFWFHRNQGNPKSKYCASRHMRLIGRLLMNLREIDRAKDQVAATIFSSPPATEASPDVSTSIITIILDPLPAEVSLDVSTSIIVVAVCLIMAVTLIYLSPYRACSPSCTMAKP